MSRDYYIDNVKGVLIFLVVLGHFIEPIRGFELTAAIAYKFIYIFHMPFFVLIAGYFAKKENLRRELGYLITFFIAQILLILVFGYKFRLLDPIGPLWFLVALFFWIVMLKYLKDIKYILIFSVIAALIAGYWNEFGSLLALRRTIMFFPFFLLGYKIPWEGYKKWIVAISKKQALIGILYYIVIITILFLFYNISYKNLWYAGDKSYDYLLKVIPEYWGAIFQLGVYLSSIVLIYFVSVLIPKTKVWLLTQIGENSMVVYILHIFVWYAMKKWDVYDLELTFLILLISSILVTGILSLKPVKIFFDFVFNQVHLIRFQEIVS